MALDATIYRSEAVRLNLGEIWSCTGRNLSQARVATEVKCLPPPNSLYMHRRFQNRTNQVHWVIIGTDMTRNVECISVTSHVAMFYVHLFFYFHVPCPE